LSRFVAIVWQALWSNRKASTVVPHWLERARRGNGGSFDDNEVADARYVTRLFPFLATLVLFWCVYSQMNLTFFNQGCQMDLRIGSLTVPVAALGVINGLCIVILIPIVDKLLFPCLRR
jgi:peptide/histidine transporter 3/4